jgi:hypothetical protein
MRELSLHDLTDVGGGDINGAVVNLGAAAIRGTVGSFGTGKDFWSFIDSAQRGWLLTTVTDYACVAAWGPGGGAACGAVSALAQSYAHWPASTPPTEQTSA